MISFAQRLQDAFDTVGQLCVGIDPHPYLLSEWGYTDDAASLREFGLRVVDAAAGRVPLIKPQVAFFERHGSMGYAALEAVLAAARDAGLLVIADAKRGDVGSTVEAYGQAWLSPGSPLEADAMTVSAFQGVGSLRAPHELALASGKGLFVLAATSNPESSRVQTAVTGTGETVTSAILREIRELNAAENSAAENWAAENGAVENGAVENKVAEARVLGSVGAVVGATVDFAAFGIDDSQLAGMPILAPGLGHQGARVEDVAAIYGSATPRVIVSASRSILAAGPSGLRAAIERQASDVATAVQR
ncbi:MAG: orotidine-5'-phosphate decarboxylase [Microbacteriaceae bacterium]